MKDILHLDRYPLDREGSTEWQRLVEQSRSKPSEPTACSISKVFCGPPPPKKRCGEIKPIMDTLSFTHNRTHNIYFRTESRTAADHLALRKVETINHTVCGDQIPSSMPLGSTNRPHSRLSRGDHEQGDPVCHAAIHWRG